jgi:phospholipid N-methyltransferase
MMTVLRPGGQFVTFAYLHGLPLPAGRRFANRLPEYFSEISRSRTVWMNLPPALVYRCRR